MTNWILADNHFNHERILEYEHRPYLTVEDMDVDMIFRWNGVVKPEDKVYYLGDFALVNVDEQPRKDFKEYVCWLARQLYGEINLIKGNHDRFSNTFYQTELGWYVFNKPIIWRKPKIILSHRKQDVEVGWLNLHGHSHSKGVNDKQHYCVSVENINYTPVDLDELIKKLKK
jgi:calcineurin-like phosphoesterase family protein